MRDIPSLTEQDLRARLYAAEKRAEEAEKMMLIAQEHCDQWIEKFYAAQRAAREGQP